jgi:hypothetical protein
MSTHTRGLVPRRTRSAIRAPQPLSVPFAALGGAVFFALVVINSNLLSGAPSAPTQARRPSTTWHATRAGSNSALCSGASQWLQHCCGYPATSAP